MTKAEIRNHVWTNGVATYIWKDFFGWIENVDNTRRIVPEYKVVNGIASGQFRKIEGV